MDWLNLDINTVERRFSGLEVKRARDTNRSSVGISRGGFVDAHC